MISNGKSHHHIDTDSERSSARPSDAPCDLAREALHELLTAYQYSRQVGHDVWDFAVSVRAMHAAGLSESDLRWLVCEELVLHACEVTRVGDQSRQFQATHPLVFTTQNCFVLTERGCDFARSILDQQAATRNGVSALTAPSEQDDEQPAEFPRNGFCDPTARPHWESDRHELRLGNVLVKQFKWPAINQEMVLAAFQEEDWPFRIDDPLSPQPDQDPKRRLSDTIKCLNRKQKTSLLHFRGDGTGEGVIWEVAERI